MKDIKNIFRNLEKKLKQARWFEADWEVYNRGSYLQLYKTTWHNHNQGGVHFETFIEKPQIQQKAFPIFMHAEEDCPSQPEFIRKFLDRERVRIKSWKGYETVGQRHTVFQRIMPLNFKNLEQRLFDELSQFRQLETSIEEVFSEL